MGNRAGVGEYGSGVGKDLITITAMAEEYGLRVGGAGRRPHGDVQGKKQQKRRGEIAEALFLAKMAMMGYAVATPWGDSERYDAIVDTGSRLLRVQVKSAHRVSANAGGGYHVRAHGHLRKSYRACEIDLLVAYVVPEDAWYVFPPAAFEKMKSMRLFPLVGKKRSKFEDYREGWGWFE